MPRPPQVLPIAPKPTLASGSPIVKPHLLAEGCGFPVPGLTRPEYCQPQESFVETLFSAQNPLGSCECECEDGVPSASHDYVGAEEQLNFSTTRDPTGGRDVGSGIPPGTHPSLLKLTGKPALRRSPSPARCWASPWPSPRAGFHISAPPPFSEDFISKQGLCSRSQVPQSSQESVPLKVCGAGGRCLPPPEYDSLFLVQRLFLPQPQSKGM